MGIDFKEHLDDMVTGLKSAASEGVQGADVLYETAEKHVRTVKALSNPQDRRQAFKSLAQGVESGLARINDETARSILDAIIKPALTIGKMLLGIA